MMDSLLYILHEIPFYTTLCFDVTACFSLLWCVFYMIDEALGRLVLRGARRQADGWRFMMIMSACVIGFHSAAAVQCKNLFRDTFLPDTPTVLEMEKHIGNILAVISLLWAGYAVFRLVRYIRSRRLTSRCLHCLPDMPPDAAFARASIETAMSPECKVWQEAKGISVFGIHNPVMIVPDGFAQKYTDDERYCLYLHELMHILRRDTLINLLTDVCEIIFWIFPPIVWEMRRLREHRELQCDISVLKHQKVEPVFYGELLLREIKFTNNRLLVGFSDHRFKNAKVRLDAVLGNTKALSLKILVIYLIVGVLLMGRFLAPVSEMPYERVVSVISTNGDFNTLYFEEEAADRQDREQLIARVYTDYDKQDIEQIVVQYPKFYYAGLFGFYLSSDNENLLPE